MRIILTLSLATLLAATAAAQPGVPPSNTPGIPGLYGGGLSPYLNLRSRNLNPAVGYYNFTRPYTGGTFGNAFATPNMAGGGANPAASMSRFFPNQVPYFVDEDTPRQRLPKDDVGGDENGLRPVIMPPAGHGGGFMNTQGYFGSFGGQRAGGQPAASLGRPRAR